MNNFGKLCRIFFWRCKEIWSSEIVLFPPPLLWNLMTHQNVSGWQGGNMKQMINVKFGGFKTSTHTDTHVGTLSQNTIHMLPHAHTLEAITYANTSSPVFDKDRQSQVSVLHTQLPSSKQQDAATPASGYLITFLKKFQYNHLQKLQRQGQ